MSEQLKNRLQDFEVKPPATAWDNISNELNQNNLPFARKMYHFEVTPPLGTWEAIFNHLKGYTDQDQASPGLIKKPVYKMAVAAAVLGVIVLGGWFFFQNSSLKKQQLSPNLAGLNPGQKADTNTKKQDTSLADPLDKLQIAAASDYRFIKGKKKSNQEKRRQLRNAIVKNVRTIGSELAIMIAAKPIRNERGDIIHDPEILDPATKYIDITGPNGEQTRISSKFINGLLYLNESTGIEEYEGYFDKSFLESLMWKSRFQDWRNKIIQTSFIPSSTNFLDILEFKELLKDTENQ